MKKKAPKCCKMSVKDYCLVSFKFQESYASIEGQTIVTDLFFEPYMYDGEGYGDPRSDARFIEYSVNGNPFVRVVTPPAPHEPINITNFDRDIDPLPIAATTHTIVVRVDSKATVLHFYGGGTTEFLYNSCPNLDLFLEGVLQV